MGAPAAGFGPAPADTSESSPPGFQTGEIGSPTGPASVLDGGPAFGGTVGTGLSAGNPGDLSVGAGNTGTTGLGDPGGGGNGNRPPGGASPIGSAPVVAPSGGVQLDDGTIVPDGQVANVVNDLMIQNGGMTPTSDDVMARLNGMAPLFAFFSQNGIDPNSPLGQQIWSAFRGGPVEPVGNIPGGPVPPIGDTMQPPGWTAGGIAPLGGLPGGAGPGGPVDFDGRTVWAL